MFKKTHNLQRSLSKKRRQTRMQAALDGAAGRSPLIEVLESRTLLSGNGLLGEYFNNMHFAGKPSRVQVDAQVNVFERNASPAPGVNWDGWSAVWSGQVLAPKTETYTFYTDTDSGDSVIINGKTIINNGSEHHAVTRESGTVALQGGQKYNITVLYYHQGGPAEMQLLWSYPGTGKQLVPSTDLSTSYVATPAKTSGGSSTGTKTATVAGTGAGLNALYFNNTTLSGLPSRAQIDPQINLNINGASPAPGVDSWNWSAWWNGNILAPTSGTYTFYADANSGVRLWVNGQEIINNWNAGKAASGSGTITLTAGQHYAISAEYFHTAGPAKLSLQWSGPSFSQQVIPSSALYSAGSVSSASGSTTSGVTGGSASSTVAVPTVTVQTTGGTASSLPTGQQINWTWTGRGHNVTFTVTRLNPDGSVTTLATNYSGNSFTDFTPIANVSDPAVYYYSVTAQTSAGSSEASTPVSAPQIYYFEGGNDTSGPLVQLTYDANLGCEFHFFSLDSVFNFNTDKWNFSAIDPSAGPLVVVGFSNGGEAALRFCDYVQNTLNRGSDLDYLALLSPVQVFDEWSSIGDSSSSVTVESSFSPQYVQSADDWYTPLSQQSRRYSGSSIKLPEGPIVSNNPDYANHPAAYRYHGAVVWDTDVQGVIGDHLSSIAWKE